jgi:hypothetical protein
VGENRRQGHSASVDTGAAAEVRALRIIAGLIGMARIWISKPCGCRHVGATPEAYPDSRRARTRWSGTAPWFEGLCERG